MATGDRGGAIGNVASLTPAQARAVLALHQQAQRQVRAQQRYNILTAHARGEISTQEAHARLQQAGLLPTGALKPTGLMKVAATTIGNLADAAIHAPGGAYASEQAVQHDVGAASHGDLSFKNSRRLGGQIVQSTKQDFEHPLRNPGYTALDAFAALSAGAGAASRLAAAGKAARAGELAATAKALVKRPEAGVRTYRQGGMEVQTPNSHNALVRGVQKAHASYVNTRAGEGAQARVVGRHVAHEQRILDAANKADAAALAAAGRKLTTPQETALRVVAEGKPIGDRIAMHQREIAAAKSAQVVRDSRQKIALLTAAQRYVENIDGVPHLKQKFSRPLLTRVSRIVGRGGATADQLGDIYKKVEAVTAKREQTLQNAGRLSADAIEGRKHAPGQVIENGKVTTVPKPDIPGQLSLVEPDKGFQGGKLRIPYTATASRPRNLHAPAAYRGGVPQAPGSVTHEFKGTLLRTGNFRDKVTKLVAESGLEAERYASVLRLRDRIVKAAKDQVPHDQLDKYQPVRVEPLQQQSPRLRQLTQKAEDGLTLSRAERDELAKAFDDWHAQVFPDATKLGPEELKGVKWVRKELIARASPPRTYISDKWARRGIRAVDEVNNATKTAMLYLAPKYAVPNLLGNVAMNVLQQGFAAPGNLARAARIAAKAGPETAARVDAMMGEGFAGTLHLKGGPAQAVGNLAANAWGRAVDRIPRRAAFIHEARVAGFKTPDQLNRLLTDESLRPKLVEVTQRALDAIGDYDRMGNLERNVIRRVIFFYPWLKVSTRYSGHLIASHPVESAALAQVGRQGQRIQKEQLGVVPSFANGVFKVGEHNYPGVGKLPVVSNPSSANIFSAADVVKSLGNLLHGRYAQSGEQIAGNVTPSIGTAIALLTGRDAFTGAPLKGNLAQNLWHELAGASPQLLLKQRLDRAKGDQSGKMYMYTPKQAWQQFYLGPLGPRGYNLDAAHQLARKEQLADVPPVKRSYITVFQRRNAFAREMRRLGMLENGRMPKPVRDAFNLEAERQAAYTSATHGIKAGTLEYQKARFVADIKLLRKYKQVDELEAEKMYGWSTGNVTLDELKQARAYVSRHYYQAKGTGFLWMLSETRKYLEKHGAQNLPSH